MTLLAAGPAQATGYRYWSFWERDGGRWVYATQGPSTTRPADGSVQGFRFSVSEDSAVGSPLPRGTAEFATLCKDTPAREGKKRVALLVDFGLPRDAPQGESPPQSEPRGYCASLAPAATTAEALAVVATPLRYNSAALLCAIAGYPRRGCGDQVAQAEPRNTAPAPAPSTATAPGTAESGGGSGPSVGLLAAVSAVIALATAALWQNRRRRTR
ncbi:SCO2322 family protein [Streptomyces sp. NPDC006879]|uniref:SCO2322 family protein n=1 Tax=Streptomyces sp. NPDC006879 TaxID=3364767 RepID=UPI0036AB79CB